MSVMSECVDALAACILACTSNTPLSPDGGPAVALLENDTLHNNFKQTCQAELLSSALIWMSEKRL